MQRITVFSGKFVKIIILIIKRSYKIGDVRTYHTDLMKNIIKHKTNTFSYDENVEIKTFGFQKNYTTYEKNLRDKLVHFKKIL